MRKESSSLYKMPYFNVETQTLKWVGKLQQDIQEVICICKEVGCNNIYEGFNYSFSYSATPTIEPISYKLKGYEQQSNLQYDDIGLNINNDVSVEIYTTIEDILETAENSMPSDIFNHLQNSYQSQKLSNNIFQKENSYLYRGEIYNDVGYLDYLIPNIKISSNIYTINVQYSIVAQV